MKPVSHLVFVQVFFAGCKDGIDGLPTHEREVRPFCAQAVFLDRPTLWKSAGGVASRRGPRQRAAIFFTGSVLDATPDLLEQRGDFWSIHERYMTVRVLVRHRGDAKGCRCQANVAEHLVSPAALITLPTSPVELRFHFGKIQERGGLHVDNRDPVIR